MRDLIFFTKKSLILQYPQIQTWLKILFIATFTYALKKKKKKKVNVLAIL